MDFSEVLIKIEDILKDIVEDNDLRINYETTANDIKGWDSLTNILLDVEIEKQFKIKFKLEEVQNFQNVGQMCECVLEKLNKKKHDTK